MKNSPAFHIGTTGWIHDAWKGVFYPEQMHKSKYLEHYAASFPAVEMTSTYYQMPPAKVLIEFASAVPDSFRFSVRANRYITDIKKLKDGKLILPPFLTRMDCLGEKLGPILLQLPPNWSFNRDRLKSFIEAMPGDRRWVFEFHHPSWYNESTYELLAEKNAALGIFQLGEKITPRISTADFVYVRLVKPRVKDGAKIPGLLKTWMDNFQDWSGSGKDIFCYFYQAGDDCAVLDAMNFRSAIESAIGAGRERGRLLDMAGIVKAQTSPVRRRSLRHGDGKRAAMN
jgi:uncharacterized protein YecE (DUF72 family)